MFSWLALNPEARGEAPFLKFTQGKEGWSQSREKRCHGGQPGPMSGLNPEN